MNNKNETNESKSSGVIQVVAAVLLLVLLVGVIAVLVMPRDNGTDDTTLDSNKGTVVIDGDGNSMQSGQVYAMPANMIFATTAAEASNASEGITLSATVKPVSADNKALDWRVEFVNQSSNWATGKTVTDYVTITTTTDGAATATVNCLKAFGEQIKIIVSSRSNPNAKAECILDYARRILDTAIYHEGMGSNLLEFGSDEILVDMIVPSYDDFIAYLQDGTIWLDGYYLDYPAESDNTDTAESFTYVFSDYTIKDCQPFGTDEYALEKEIIVEYADELYEMLEPFSYDVRNTGRPQIPDIDTRVMSISNNPISLMMQILINSGYTIDELDEDIYWQYIDMFVEWVQSEPDMPIVEYTVKYSGKYTTFGRKFSFRYNPNSVEIPVLEVELDKGSIVI